MQLATFASVIVDGKTEATKFQLQNIFFHYEYEHHPDRYLKSCH